MYYVFDSVIKSWRNRLLQAELQGKLPDFQPHWWLAKPFSASPQLMTFSVASKAPHPDNYFTGSPVELYSKNLTNLLKTAGIKHELLEVNLIDRKTKSVLSIDYSAFHLLEIYPAWDVNFSIVDERYRVKKLVLTEQTLKEQNLFFRLEKLYITLIHQKLKDILDEAGVTGCIYTPVDDYHYRDVSEL